jgi:Carboxypeptidase regulatory-like domain/TonB dependent receptor
MKSVFGGRITFAVALATLIFSATFVLAQGIVTGSISGVVQDPQGAVVANASVTVTHLTTNRVSKTQSTSSGFVSLRDLPPGAYNVKIDAANFRAYESKNLTVNVGKDTNLGMVQLQLGSSSESVTVEGTAPLIEASTDQISDTFSAEKVVSLPMGNSFDSLALFLPGVASAGDASFSNNNGAEMTVNGLRARANNFQIDGQSNNDNSIAGPSIFFGNQDAISELQVVTNYDAEFGRNTGAVINYVTKSGTNAFHGTAYEFWQGSTFDSLENNEKNPLLGFCLPGQATSTGCIKPEVPGFVDNRFGGTVGGPIKKDKIWFFGSANVEHQRFAGSPASTAGGLVPTPNGVNQLEAAFPSSPIGMIENTIGPNAVAAGNPVFTNVQNVLVTNQIDPSSGFAFPCTTAGVNGCTPVEFGEMTRFVPGPFNDYEATGRLDFKLSEKDNFFGRYVYQKSFSGGVNFGNGIQIGDWQSVPGLSQQIGLDWVRNISNTFVNQVRFSFSRASSFFEEQSFSGCNSTNPTNCPTDMILIGSAPQDSVSFGVSAGFPQGRIINVYQLQDNASMQKGRHAIKYGAEVDQQRSPNVFLPENNGVFVFTSFSDVIANNPLETQIALGSPTLPFSEWDLGFYVQDDWRIQSNLTLNLGMRWDWYQQAMNLLHDQSVKEQTGSNPLWSTTLPLSQTTVPSIPQSLKNFAPVLGFAWTPRILTGLLGADKTVIRGGFRIAYDPAFYNMFLNVATGAPKVNLATLGPVVGQAPTGVPSNGVFGTQVIPFLGPLAAGGNPGFASQIQVPSNFHNPYTEQWNLGIQHSFTPRIVAEVRYVGNHAVGQFQELNGNPALQPLIAAGFGNLIPSGMTPCTDPTAPGSSAGYANCNFTNVIKYANTASSNYNGLQTQLRIANWHGLTATGAYTYSHTIDNASEVFSTLGGGNTLAYSQNPFDTSNAERANSGIDFPHTVGIAVVYDIPAFKAQRGLLGHLLGGWQVNTTYRYSSGQPYTTIQRYVNGSLCDPTGNFGGSFDACRPIVSNAGAPLDTVGQFTCTGATAGTCSLSDFVTGLPTTLNSVHWIQNSPAAAIFYGTPFAGGARNTLRGQDISTANLAFFKNIKVTERLTAQFQAQAFDVFNAQFRGVPDPILDDVARGSFQNTDFNSNGGLTFAGNNTTDGIGRRRLLFGMKLIF